MTFTLRKMSGKGIRMVARYLAVLKLGGSLEDTPEEFYNRLMADTEKARAECERAFTKSIDWHEEQLRDEEGYMSRNDVQRVAAFVEHKLGPGMWIEGEVAADHLKQGVATTPRSRVAPEGVPKVSSDVGTLVKQLKGETDSTTRRKIRRQLRKLGHRGGAQ